MNKILIITSLLFINSCASGLSIIASTDNEHMYLSPDSQSQSRKIIQSLMVTNN
ncbi:MAG: hypothetical protein HON23_01420 [Rickettsiales bacterium]|nr:hypothetical protein [Rickettsiales bacterium]